MRIRSWYKHDSDMHMLTIEFPKMLLEEAPDLRNFLGMFNVRSLQFVGSSKDSQEFVIEPETDMSEVANWVVLKPERLSMQLLKYAYLAALAEEGPYGVENV